MRRRNKYGNRRTPCRQGKMHDSALEARACNDLHLRQAAGEICDLRSHPQPSYPLIVNGELICHIRPDFEYNELRQGFYVFVTADAKGKVTAEWCIKAKLFEAIYGRKIVEIRAR